MRNYTISAELSKEEQVRLVRVALDSLKKVHITDKNLGTANPMFRIWSWDVKPLLKLGENCEPRPRIFLGRTG